MGGENLGGEKERRKNKLGGIFQGGKKVAVGGDYFFNFLMGERG